MVVYRKIRNRDFDIYFPNFLTLAYFLTLRAALLYAHPKYGGVQAPRCAVLPKPSKLERTARVHSTGEKRQTAGKGLLLEERGCLLGSTQCGEQCFWEPPDKTCVYHRDSHRAWPTWYLNWSSLLKGYKSPLTICLPSTPFAPKMLAWPYDADWYFNAIAGKCSDQKFGSLCQDANLEDA